MGQRVAGAINETRRWFRYVLERDTMLRSIRTALVVGTILGLLNHGPQLVAGRFAPEWVVPLLLTYLVPFSVATYGQVQGKRQRDRLRASGAPAGALPVGAHDR